MLEPEFELVGIEEDGRAMLEAVDKLKPDVVVADVSMPLLNGIDAVRLLKKKNKEIASILNISTRTVEFHKYGMMEVLGLKSSAELVRFAVKHGLITE